MPNTIGTRPTPLQNRLVAREPERRFEKALQESDAVTANASERLQKLEVPLSPAEEQQLKAYAEEVAKLWRAPGTRVQERKRIARCLLEKIVVWRIHLPQGTCDNQPMLL